MSILPLSVPFLTFLLLLGLVGCSTPAPKLIPVLPPASLLEPCSAAPVPTRTNGDLAKAIPELAAVIKCERADKEALREWRDKASKL